MQNIWFNISIFYHALTAERINSTLQFPRTSMLNLCFFFYIRISVFCPIWSHLIFLSLLILLCFFPLSLWLKSGRLKSNSLFICYINDSSLNILYIYFLIRISDKLPFKSQKTWIFNLTDISINKNSYLLRCLKIMLYF